MVNAKKKWVDILLNSVLFLLMLLMLYPFWNIFAVSISSTSAVVRNEVFLIPKEINFDMYKAILSLKEVQIGYYNSVMYTVVFTVLTLLSTALMAYPLSVSDLPGKKFFNIFVTIPMFINSGMVPMYLLIKELGGIDSFWVMVIPGCFGAWNVILMRTFFQSSIDKAILESAKLDGAGEFRTLFNIILPLSKPIFATLGLFAIVAKWNSWFEALIYLNDTAKYPIQMILRQVVIEGTVNASVNNALADLNMAGGASAIPVNFQYALLMVVVIPIIMVYPFIQKYFVKGVMIGSIKG